jgi:Na+/melibiose symporter-like transporter
MIDSSQNNETLHSNLERLILKHRNTRAWFWRTGLASLLAAFLWIIVFAFAPDNIGVRESFAIIIGAILMWILFLWSFFLRRKLARLTMQVKQMEEQLTRSLS